MVLDFAREALANSERDRRESRIRNISKAINTSSWSEEQMDAFLLGYAIAKEEK